MSDAAPLATADAGTGWAGRLHIDYRLDAGRTVAHDRHHGPLRVLQPLYPEGPAVCHHVLVHPPGGLVGGDTLDIELDVGPGCHALLTSPGAARFYRSTGLPAAQRARARLAPGARLEWLPQETLAYDGCRAHNGLSIELAPGAEMLGWDVLALGLPAAGRPFERGHVELHLEWPGVWLERGRIDATDALLRQSALGLDGQGVLATLWWASGTPLTANGRDRLIEAARDCIAQHPTLAARAGATAPDDRLIVVRALAMQVEPVQTLWRALRGTWRALAWGLAPNPPRIWRT